MKSRFFESLMGSKAANMPTTLPDDKALRSFIKPANDILDFEYPIQSPFYHASEPPSESAGELHPNWNS